MPNRHVSEAQKWLEPLRHGTFLYESFIANVREEAQKGNLSLADIGTSEKELEELRIKGCKVAARDWLSHLRRGTDHYDLNIALVRNEAQKGSFTLEDIDTSEDELEKLRIKGCWSQHACGSAFFAAAPTLISSTHSSATFVAKLRKATSHSKKSAQAMASLLPSSAHMFTTDTPVRQTPCSMRGVLFL
jgi:hypothetical protein